MGSVLGRIIFEWTFVFRFGMMHWIKGQPLRGAGGEGGGDRERQGREADDSMRMRGR